MTITATEVKEARKLLGWTVPGLAAQSGVDAKRLEAFEREKGRMSVLDLSVIQRTLSAAGIEFVGGKAPEVKRKAAVKDGDALPDIPDDDPYDGAPV
jgi:transcriptional regulator with XRE-family HTH domain